MKFYIIDKEVVDENLIEINEQHKIFPFDYERNNRNLYFYVLINLTPNELKEIDYVFYELKNFIHWNNYLKCNDFEIELHEFLKTKHKFIKNENNSDCSKHWDDYMLGINYFELDEKDLMYIKLLM